jgi:multiple sugar transport system ATP-binding protein
MYADEGSFKIKLNAKQKKLLKDYEGKQMTFGIRPEDLMAAEKPEEGKTIDATVMVIEPLGAETHVFVNTRSNQLIARVEPDINLKVNQKVSMVPNLDKVTFFDGETEVAVV